MLSDRRLTATDQRGSIQIWDVDRWTELLRLHGHRGIVNITCQVDAAHLASGARDNTVRMWDLPAANFARLSSTQRSTASSVTARLVAADAIGRMHWLDLML